MRVLMLGIVSLILSTASATAQTSPQQCAAIKAPAQRLACFDRLFTETPSAASPQSWHMSETTSAIDGSAQISGFLLPRGSENKIVLLNSIALGLRCQNNVTSAIITTGTSAASETAKVTYSVNSNAPQTNDWQRSANFLSVGLWSDDAAIPLIKQLKNDTILTIKIDNPPVEAIFDLAMVENLTEKIAHICNWK